MIYYENIPVQKRFTTPIYHFYRNKIIKSTVRGNLSFNYWRGMQNPHSSNNNLTACNSMGKIIDPKKYYNSPFNYEFSYLKHYSTKTIEEYCNKSKRGRSDTLVILNKKTLESYFKYFFKLNKKTKAKIDYFNKYFNITIS